MGSEMCIRDRVAEAYYKEVHGGLYAKNANGYIFPCNSSLPPLSVAVGPSYSVTIPGSFMNWSEVGTNTTTGETGEFFPLSFKILLWYEF